MRKLVYLAAPYSDPSFDVRMLRYQAATFIASELMLRGELIYSPVTHGHAIAMERRNIGFNRPLPTDWEFWSDHCEAILAECELMLVLSLPGYKESKGVESELQLARDHVIPWRMLSPWDFIDRTEYLKGFVKKKEGEVTS